MSESGDMHRIRNWMSACGITDNNCVDVVDRPEIQPGTWKEIRFRTHGSQYWWISECPEVHEYFERYKFKKQMKDIFE